MGENTDTDRLQAVKLKHLSPTWVRWLDRRAGIMKHLNKGYWDLHARFTAGRESSTKIEESYVPDQWRNSDLCEMSPSQ